MALGWGLVWGGLGLSAAPARAQFEELDAGDVHDDAEPAWMRLGPAPEKFARVIQRRKYALRHELDLMGSGLPVDPMVKGLSGTVGYAVHFSHYVAWELARFSYLYRYPTRLQRQLRAVQAAVALPEVNNALAGRGQIVWFAASRLVVKPLYGKQGLMDRGLVHLEIALAAGPAYVQLKQVFGTQARHALGADIALGLRLWLGRHVSIRAELADLVYFSPRPGHALHVGGGLALSVGGRR